MKKVQEVFDSHMIAVATLNPKRVIENYSSDAIFITPDRTYSGRNKIFKFYK